MDLLREGDQSRSEQCVLAFVLLYYSRVLSVLYLIVSGGANKGAGCRL